MHIFLAEFNALREEINHLNSWASSALHNSVVTSLAVIGILSQLKELNFILYPIPFLVLSHLHTTLFPIFMQLPRLMVA